MAKQTLKGMSDRTVAIEMKMAIGSVYRIRMGRSYDTLPKGWPERLHKVEAELVALKKILDGIQP